MEWRTNTSQISYLLQAKEINLDNVVVKYLYYAKFIGLITDLL